MEQRRFAGRLCYRVSKKLKILENRINFIILKKLSSQIIKSEQFVHAGGSSLTSRVTEQIMMTMRNTSVSVLMMDVMERLELTYLAY